MHLFTNCFQKWRIVESLLLNTQLTESSQHAQQTWEQERDNPSSVSSLVLPIMVLTRKNLNKFPSSLAYKHEEWEDSTQQWTKKEQLTYPQWRDLVLHRLMWRKSYLMDLLNCTKSSIASTQTNRPVGYSDVKLNNIIFIRISFSFLNFLFLDSHIA